MNKNYFSLLNEGSVQMHGFEHLSDTFYVKPLVTKNSLTIYATPHSDCVKIMLDANRKIKTEGIEFLFRRFHMLDYYFIYVEPTHSYLATNIPVEHIRIQKARTYMRAFSYFVSERYSSAE